MKKLCTLLSILVLSGCSSISARVGDDTQAGKPYAGASYAVDNLVDCNVSALLVFPPAPIILLPISIADIALSTVTDTVLLPIDLIIDGQKKGKQSLCHINMSH